MKWVVWVGSVRKGSYNAAVARALRALAPADVEIEILPSVAALPIYDADIQAEGMPEAVTALGATIGAADGLVIVTPEYNYSIPGGLKNAIDWVSRLKDQPFKGKPILLQSASMGVLGGARAQYHLRQVFVFLDGRLMNVPEVMVPTAHKKMGEDGELNDAPTRDFIAKQLEAFKAFVTAR
ncbi:NADPH-dependent FMN reductase [Aquabacter spiritensis]|uniref:Chromate reductase n=1 Tax=Aquabacter spiritensis TaxID=933073 RepID=A0A4V2UYM2_9HYPH|nr:NADPH-dependent FMN reductase [Aquabacter spiritensis]TCT07718.1 chromate reductase [Aquabacter spiritensis]